jgi:hypothetical protein
MKMKKRIVVMAVIMSHILIVVMIAVMLMSVNVAVLCRSECMT